MKKAFQFDTQVPDRRENMSLHNFTYIAGGFNKTGTPPLLDKVDNWCLLEILGVICCSCFSIPTFELSHFLALFYVE